MNDLLNFEVANFETRFVWGFTSNDVQIWHPILLQYSDQNGMNATVLCIVCYNVGLAKF